MNSLAIDLSEASEKDGQLQPKLTEVLSMNVTLGCVGGVVPSMHHYCRHYHTRISLREWDQ